MELVKNMIDVRAISANLVSRYYDKVDHSILIDVTRNINDMAVSNMETFNCLNAIKEKMIRANNATAKMLYADAWAYAEYISGVAINKLLNISKPIPLCNRRNLDTCAMYCEGYDTACENYLTDDEIPTGFIGTCSRFEDDEYAEAIEVCSFEEGDPQ